MAEAELIEQLRAQVQLLKSPREAALEQGPSERPSSAASSTRSRITANLSGVTASTLRSCGQIPLLTGPEPAEDDFPIVLDIGGYSFRTTTDTLRSVESSYFCQLLDNNKTRDGPIFVDRNGEMFGYVLEYLRGHAHNETESVELPIELKKLKALKREASFYRLPELVSLVSSTIRTYGSTASHGESKKDKNRKGSYDNDAESMSSVIIQEDDPIMEQEIDVIFHSISNPHCHFSEERIQELTRRVNYTLSLKQAEGFKIKGSSSDVVFEREKEHPFTMFVHITLMRDKRREGSIFSPTERSRATGSRALYQAMSFPHHRLTYDPLDGVEYTGTPRSRVSTAPPSPRAESTNGRYPPQHGLEIVPESAFAGREYRSEVYRNQRGNYRPRQMDQTDWDYSREHRSPSPRGTGPYRTSSSPPPRKPSGRTPLPRRFEASSKVAPSHHI